MMKNIRTILNYVSLLIFISMLAACESEKRDLIEGPEIVVFEDDIQPIFTKCTQCHSGSVPPDLSEGKSYLVLTAGGYLDLENPENSKLYEAINGGSMTQYANDLDRAYIKKWIEQEAEQNN